MSLMKTIYAAVKYAMSITITIALMALIGCSSGKKVAQIETPEPQVVTPKPKPKPVVELPEQDPEMEMDIKPTSLILANVYFDFDKFDLKSEARDILGQHARALKTQKDVTVIIEGHCDERGTIEYNLALGDKRARAVKDYLVLLGVERSRLTTISYGKERPLDYGHNESAWSENRRAQFVIKAMMGASNKT